MIMNVFQQCWANWTKHVRVDRFKWPESEFPWINELNQAVFKRLENILPAGVKVRAVTTPVFTCYHPAAGGYGVDYSNKFVETHKHQLPVASFEERVEFAANWLKDLIGSNTSVFFYFPIFPNGNEPGTEHYKNQVFVRLYATTDETVDIDEQV